MTCLKDGGIHSSHEFRTFSASSNTVIAQLTTNDNMHNTRIILLCKMHGKSNKQQVNNYRISNDYNNQTVFIVVLVFYFVLEDGRAHVLADALGSVGVIVSSVIIYFWELFVFDGLCSVFISILIFMTIYPLISETSKILLEGTKNYIINALETDLSIVLSVPHYENRRKSGLCVVIAL